MNLHALPASFYEFIASNSRSDPRNLRLKSHGKTFDFDIDFAITQIAARKKAIYKLPDFISNSNTLFPSELAYEQATHESVAAFHATLLTPHAKVLDMTAGLGIDAMALSNTAKCVTACESDAFKAEILKYNAEVLGINNLKVKNTDSIDYLSHYQNRFDFIFADPARRGESNSRVYNLHDCVPNLLEVMDLLLTKCSILLIKASPLLDVSQTLRDIPFTKKIRAISVAGECKEVLIEASQGATLEKMEAIDLSPNGNVNYKFSFSPDLKIDISEYATDEDITPGKYLYEPGAAVMKLSPWSQLMSQYEDLAKLSHSSHLFISNELYATFPGRILKIDSIIDKKSRKNLKGFPANIVTRNYPLTAEELRKKLGVKEGTDNFIYATRLGNSHILISATRIRI